jgi:phage shock protein E
MQQLSLADIHAREDIRIIDVRSTEEYQDGHMGGAELIPQPLIAMLAAERLPNKSEPLVLYCMAGGRATLAAQSLEALGYTDVSVLEGGYDAVSTTV